MKKMPKMKLPVVMFIFGLTLSVTHWLKPSINDIDAETLANEVIGIGYAKSQKIINERDKNGEFENKQDFYKRVKKLGIGEVVYNRINKQYKY